MQANSEIKVPEIAINLEDQIDLTSFLIDSTRLQNNVRKTYLRYLEILLKHNLDKYGLTDFDYEMTHKVAVSLELAAARASMVVALYQRQMKAIISDIKRNTQEGRLHLLCALASPPSQEKSLLPLGEIIPNELKPEEFEQQISHNVYLSEPHPEQNEEILNEHFDCEEEIALMNKDEFINYINLKQVPTLEPMDVLNDIEKNAWNDSTNTNGTTEKPNSQNNSLIVEKSIEKNSWNDSSNVNETRIFVENSGSQNNPLIIEKNSWNDSTNANETRISYSQNNPLFIEKSIDKNGWNESSTNTNETRIFAENSYSQNNPSFIEKSNNKNGWNESTNTNEIRNFAENSYSQNNPSFIEKNSRNVSTNVNASRTFSENFYSQNNPLFIEKNSRNVSTIPNASRTFAENSYSQNNPSFIEKKSRNVSTNTNPSRTFAENSYSQNNPLIIEKNSKNVSTNTNPSRTFAENSYSQNNPLIIEKNSRNVSTNTNPSRTFAENSYSQNYPSFIEKNSRNVSTNANASRTFAENSYPQNNPLYIEKNAWNHSINTNETRIFPEISSSQNNPLFIDKFKRKNNWKDITHPNETIIAEKSDTQNNSLIIENSGNFVTHKSYEESENFEGSHINEDTNTNIMSLDQRLENIYAGEIPVLAAIIRASEEDQEEQTTIPEPEIKTLPIKANTLTTNIPIRYEKEYLKKTTKIVAKSPHKIKKKVKVRLNKNVINKEETNKKEITFEKKPNVHFEKIEFPPKQITSTRRSTEESLDELLERQLEQVHSGIDPFGEEQNQEENVRDKDEIEREKAEMERKRFEDEDLLNHWKHIRRFYSRRQAYRMSIKSIHQNERIRVLYYKLLGERFDEDTRKLNESEQSRILFRKRFAPIIVRNLMEYLKMGYMKSRMAFKTMAKRVAAAADDLCLNENEIIDYIHNLFLDNMRFETEKDVWDYSPRVHFTSEELNNSKIKVKIEKDLIKIKQEKFD